MNCSILIPWQDGGDMYRSRNVNYTSERLAAETNCDIVYGVMEHTEQWSKGWAIRRALSECAEFVAIHDADVYVPGLQDAIEEAVAEDLPWLVPHKKVHRLTKESADRVIEGGEDFSPELPTHMRPYTGIKGGGVVITKREILEDIVPNDPRFGGWGKDDQAWRNAMDTFYGPPRRGDRKLYHLWHPEHPAKGVHPDTKRKYSLNPGNEELYKRYEAARGNKEEMRKILDECKSLF